MNLTKIITALVSIMLLMIGADKFLAFLEPPCSLMGSIPVIAWKSLGALQLIAGILIWVPGYRKQVAGFFFIFMIVFSIVHLSQGTHDIGGSIFMAVLLGLLLWLPSLSGKKDSSLF